MLVPTSNVVQYRGHARITSGNADRLFARQPANGYQLAYKIRNKYATRLTRAKGELCMNFPVSVLSGNVMMCYCSLDSELKWPLFQVVNEKVACLFHRVSATRCVSCFAWDSCCKTTLADNHIPFA